MRAESSVWTLAQHSSPTGSERQACYHELKSLKPPLGFFLAVGTAALVDGSSSAARFLGREEPGVRPELGATCSAPPESALSGCTEASRSLLAPRSESTWTHLETDTSSPHSRGCRVDVLAHPLAVRGGALAPRLGLAFLHCGFGGGLGELCLLPLLGDLWSRHVADQEPSGWTGLPEALPVWPDTPHLNIGLLVGVHKHRGGVDADLLLQRREREQGWQETGPTPARPGLRSSPCSPGHIP